jgi:hypothetical protein
MAADAVQSESRERKHGRMDGWLKQSRITPIHSSIHPSIRQPSFNSGHGPIPENFVALPAVRAIMDVLVGA